MCALGVVGVVGLDGHMTPSYFYLQVFLVQKWCLKKHSLQQEQRTILNSKHNMYKGSWIVSMEFVLLTTWKQNNKACCTHVFLYSTKQNPDDHSSSKDLWHLQNSSKRELHCNDRLKGSFSWTLILCGAEKIFGVGRKWEIYVTPCNEKFRHLSDRKTLMCSVLF